MYHLKMKRIRYNSNPTKKPLFSKTDGLVELRIDDRGGLW